VQPVALTLMGVLGHVTDYAEARSIVAALLDGLPSGSYLAINDSINTSEALEDALRQYEASGAVPCPDPQPGAVRRRRPALIAA
jgi:S-adenosyl methyltransferase